MGSVATVYLNGCNYEVGYDLISQDVAANTSYVKFWGKLHVTNNYVAWNRGTANVWGSNTTLNTRYNKGDYEVTSQNVTLYHNADGTYSHSLGGTLSTTLTSGTAQGTFSLPKIDRYAVITAAPNFNDEENPTITYNVPNKNISSLQARIENEAGSVAYIQYRDIDINGTSYTFNFTDAERNHLRELIPNSKTLTVKFVIKTVMGSSTLWSTANRTLTIVNGNPTFTAVYEDTNATSVAITNNNQQLIRNISTLEIDISNASAKKYATLVSLAAEINGETYNGTLNGTTGVINVGTLNIANNITAAVKLTDSRGFVTTNNLQLQMLDWQQPSAIIELGRQSNFYSETDIKVDANYSSLDSKNTITIQVRYKKTTDSSYSSYQTLQDNVTTTLTLDNLYQWNVQVKLTDRTSATTTYNLSVDRGMPIFYIDRLKRSIGIDCFPTQEASLEILGKTIFDMIYPIGSIYISVASTNPQTLFGGTWEQITGDAYLKIVTENAGTLAGTSSEHKIPLSSIPAHHHSVPRVAQYGNSGATANFTSGNAWQGVSGVNTSDTGGGQAYYPYYLGVYVWKRTA